MFIGDVNTHNMLKQDIDETYSFTRILNNRFTPFAGHTNRTGGDPSYHQPRGSRSRMRSGLHVPRRASGHAANRDEQLVWVRRPQLQPDIQETPRRCRLAPARMSHATHGVAADARTHLEHTHTATGRFRAQYRAAACPTRRVSGALPRVPRNGSRIGPAWWPVVGCLSNGPFSAHSRNGEVDASHFLGIAD